ncbi:endophilin-A2 isoform X3 [Parus major]|nr:endophilin-A2 isoform X3 [Parus major]
MEKKVDLTSKAVTEVLTRTIEYLQPNPASRAKLTMLNTMSKIRGQVKNPGYPQSEGLLGECMIRYGKELGEDSNFGDALLDAGESMKRLAEVKDSLDIEVKQNFIDPLQNLCDKDLKEIQHHLKKLEGRRLDFDYKKKRQGKIPDEELRQAMEKFEESKEVAETSMHNLLETDIEQVSQLSALVDAQLDYHRQAVQILDELAEKLKRRMREASSRPKREYKPKPRETYDFRDTDQSNGGFSCNPTPKVSGKAVPGVLCCLWSSLPGKEGSCCWMFPVCWMLLREPTALENVGNASRSGCFLLGPRSLCCVGFGDVPEGSPAWASRWQCQTGKPKPPSLLVFHPLHPSLPDPSRFLTAWGSCFSPNRPLWALPVPVSRPRWFKHVSLLFGSSFHLFPVGQAVPLLRQEYPPPGPALLQSPLRLRARERRRAGLQGGRHHHPDEPDRRELVRGDDPRPVRLLPAQLRGSAGPATSVKRRRSRPECPELHSSSSPPSPRHLGARRSQGTNQKGPTAPSPQQFGSFPFFFFFFSLFCPSGA